MKKLRAFRTKLSPYAYLTRLCWTAEGFWNIDGTLLKEMNNVPINSGIIKTDVEREIIDQQPANKKNCPVESAVTRGKEG